MTNWMIATLPTLSMRIMAVARSITGIKVVRGSMVTGTSESNCKAAWTLIDILRLTHFTLEIAKIDAVAAENEAEVTMTMIVTITTTENEAKATRMTGIRTMIVTMTMAVTMNAIVTTGAAAEMMMMMMMTNKSSKNIDLI